MVESYSRATRRLLVLGVGGTFLPATGATANDDSLLTMEQRELLARLLADPASARPTTWCTATPCAFPSARC